MSYAGHWLYHCKNELFPDFLPAVNKMGGLNVNHPSVRPRYFLGI